MFGGQIAAQALAAAANTAGGLRPHSLHCYFLRPGDPARPALFSVERLQDGRAFRRRRVTMTQDGKAVAALDASFTAEASFTEATAGETDYPPPPAVPAPEDCPEFAPDFTPATRVSGRRSPWDLLAVRTVPGRDDVPYANAATSDTWLRFRGGAPEGVPPEVLIAYLSDFTFGAAMLRPSRPYPAGRRDVHSLSSLDHCAWFHQPADLSDWLLFAKAPAAIGGPRGLVTGRIYGRDGTLVATVTQEALLAVPAPGGQRN
jgi:acyl-CoA thioesterase-2